MKNIRLLALLLIFTGAGFFLWQSLKYLSKKPAIAVLIGVLILSFVFYKTGEWKVLAAGLFSCILISVPFFTTSKPPCKNRQGGFLDDVPSFYIPEGLRPARVETVRVDKSDVPQYSIEVKPHTVSVREKKSRDVAIEKVFHTDEAVRISLDNGQLYVKNRFYIRREGNIYFRRLYNGQNVFGSEVLLGYKRFSVGIFAETPDRVGVEIKYRWF